MDIQGKKFKTKNLLIFALFFIFFIFMIYRLSLQGKETSDVLNHVEFYFNDSWNVISLDGAKVSDTSLKDYGELKMLIDNAISKGEYEKSSLPYTKKHKKGDILIFTNTVQQDYAGLKLEFSFTGANVRIFLDGKPLYQYESNDTDLEGSTENDEHFIDVPTDFQTGEIVIELTVTYPKHAALNDVKIQTHNMMLIGVGGDEIADISCCLLMAIMAIILFVLALIRRYTGQPGYGELFLGMAVLFSGLYYFIGTDTLSIFYNFQKAYVIRDYLSLMIPLFLAFYFGKTLSMKYPRRFLILVFSILLNAGIQIFLQTFSILDIKKLEYLSVAAKAVICAVAVISLIPLYRKNKNYPILLSIFSISVLLVGTIVNLLNNISFDYMYNNLAGQYSMTIFGIMMTVVHIFKLSKEYQAATEKNARLLKEQVDTAKQQNLQLIQAKKEADTAKQEALAANEAKSRFLARMSHEIRTPINAVLGMDEMILRESGESHIKEYAMDIYTAGQTLLSLINEILDFSKIDSGKMEIVSVDYDFCSLINDLANMISQRVQSKNIAFEVEVDHAIPSRLYGDDIHIRQILTNLLTNAVKYTHEGTVWLRVKCQASSETAVLRFEVEDTGIGIKKEDLPKLSAEFEQIEEEKNRNIEGTGLGMSITIQLLELLNSRLYVESTYGKGSKFYFELEQKILDPTPIGDFESRIGQMAESYSYNAALFAPDAKILVVDDNAVNRKVLRNLLKETKVQITEADGGRECLELVQKNHYDLLFLDHMMPEMDGVETLHHIKELSNCPCENTPVIVLTANAISGAKENYLSEGFDDFLSKPIVPEKLENLMRKMLPEELLQTKPKEPKSVIPLKKADTADELLEQLPYVDDLDWCYAWQHLPDIELLEYTVKEFYLQIDPAADKLKQAYLHISEPDALEQYRILVHSMKSLSATVGLIPLSGLAKILEYAAKDGKIDVITSLTDIFLEEWRSYRQKLQGIFGIGETSKKEVTDASVILALIEMVRISLQEMDIDQADSLIGQLLEYNYPDEIGQNIQKLSEAVTNLDSKAADNTAALLLKQIRNKT